MLLGQLLGLFFGSLFDLFFSRLLSFLFTGHLLGRLFLVLVGVFRTRIDVAEGVVDSVELELAFLELLSSETSLDGLDVLVGALDVARIEGLDYWLLVVSDCSSWIILLGLLGLLLLRLSSRLIILFL